LPAVTQPARRQAGDTYKIVFTNTKPGSVQSVWLAATPATPTSGVSVLHLPQLSIPSKSRPHLLAPSGPPAVAGGVPPYTVAAVPPQALMHPPRPRPLCRPPLKVTCLQCSRPYPAAKANVCRLNSRRALRQTTEPNNTHKTRTWKGAYL
jgi:hypothetical protein